VFIKINNLNIGFGNHLFPEQLTKAYSKACQPIGPDLLWLCYAYNTNSKGMRFAMGGAKGEE
jgi:hypothetical protein